tara:strand:+ start:3614 stop:6388 length:2775 start_codon:yes stop_codon:yes gene_type:complete
VFVAFGIDGFQADQPRDEAVRKLLETELPREPEAESQANPLKNPHRYVPQHAEAASTPKRPTYDDRPTYSPFTALGGTPRLIMAHEEIARTHRLESDQHELEREQKSSHSHSPSLSPPITMSHLEREYHSVAGQLAEYTQHTEAASFERRQRGTEGEPSSLDRNRLARYSARQRLQRPASASSSGSPRRARPAWGGGGGDFRRMEDPRAVRSGQRERESFGVSVRSIDTSAREKKEKENRARVAAHRAQSETAAVERLRAARLLRETQSGSKLAAFGSTGFGARDDGNDSHDTKSYPPRPTSSSSRGTDSFSQHPGNRLYAQAKARHTRDERDRRDELARLVHEAGVGRAYSRSFQAGMGGEESSRAFGMTNVSKALMTDARTFESRQRLFEAKKAETLELTRLRGLQLDQEETASSHKPRITRSARRMKRSVTDLEQWQRRRDQKVADARGERDRLETAELTFGPAIDSRSHDIAVGKYFEKRTKGAWSPPPSPPASRPGTAASARHPRRHSKQQSETVFVKGRDDVLFHANAPKVPRQPAGPPETPETPPSAAKRSEMQHPESPYSPRARAMEMSRALAGAALAGAAAMARMSSPAPVSAPAPSATQTAGSMEPEHRYSVESKTQQNHAPSQYGLTQVTHSHAHDTSPGKARVDNSFGKSPGAQPPRAIDPKTPPPPHDVNAFSIRNSVTGGYGQPVQPRVMGGSELPSERRVSSKTRATHSQTNAPRRSPHIPIVTTRAVEFRNAARRAAVDEAIAKEAFRPQITKKAQALKRPGDIGERLYETSARVESKSTGPTKPFLPKSAAPEGSFSVRRALDRKHEKDRTEKRSSETALHSSARTSGPEDSGGWGAYGNGGWGGYGSLEVTPAPTTRVSARKRESRESNSLQPGTGGNSREPPDRGARRSVQEAEARAREAWGYHE